MRQRFICIRQHFLAVEFFFKTGHVFFINKIKLFASWNISIKEKTAVIRTVKGLMKGQKFFICKIRNFCRVAAGRKSRIRIREHGSNHFFICNLIEGCKVGLHFVVNNTLNAHLAFLVQFHTMAFLNKGVVRKLWEENTVGINVKHNKIVFAD